MSEPRMKAEVLAAMTQLAPLAGDAVTREEARRAVYLQMHDIHGEAAVGAWEDYETKAKGTWTLEACKADALRFQTRAAWQRGSMGAYRAAQRNGWLDECCSHMPKPADWTSEACKADALQFQTRNAWQRGSMGAYHAALRNGWVDQCCAHMEPVTAKAAGSWTLEACKADALRFTTRIAWSKGSMGAYHAALRNGWVDQCCAHMPKHVQREPGARPSATSPSIWSEGVTRDRCLADARRFASRLDWWRDGKTTYAAARVNGWMADCLAVIGSAS